METALINELVLEDYIRLNAKFAHRVFEEYSSSGILPELFNRLLILEWFRYSMGN